MPVTQSRRQFLATLSFAAAARLISAPPALAVGGPLESSRRKIIADGTSWRFLNELKRELKV